MIRRSAWLASDRFSRSYRFRNTSRGGGTGTGQPLLVGPPAGQIGPRQPVGAQRAVVDQAVLLVADNAQVVVDRVVEHDVRLGSDGGEDQVLHRPAHAGSDEAVVEDRGAADGV